MADGFIDEIIESYDGCLPDYVGMRPEEAADEIVRDLIRNSGKEGFLQDAINKVMGYLNNYDVIERKERHEAICKKIDSIDATTLPRDVRICFELIN